LGCHLVLRFRGILWFGPWRSHSSVPTRAMVRLPRTAAVKDGPFLGPPEGLVLDGSEQYGRLVCVGIDRGRWMPPLIIDRREISDRGMASSSIAEAFDEFKDRMSRLSLRLEAAPIEQLAFEGGEETLAHGVVVSAMFRASSTRCLASVVAIDRPADQVLPP
jgi:hypothetical protein